MRVLLTTQPAYGHFRPLLPLADALRVRGHEVRVATSASFRAVIEDHGYAMHPAGIDWVEGDHKHTPDELRPSAGASLAESFAHQFVSMTAAPLARDVVALSRSWRPDVIIRETIEFGGALAADLLGVPVVGLQVASPSAITPDLLGTVERAWNVVRASLGLPPDTDLRRLRAQPVICFAPPSLHDPGVPMPSGLVSFGPPPIPDGPAIPDLDRLGRERPLVYATLGTVFSDASFDLPFFPIVLDALAGQALDLVLTIGPNGDPGSLGTQPPNVLVASYLPQRAVLQRSRVVICHAGYGTLLDAIDAAVPLVVVPFGADQHANAQSVERLGIGRIIDSQELTAASVREAVAAVLTEARGRNMIEGLRDEWRRLPGPMAAAGLVEQMVGRPAPAAPVVKGWSPA